MELATIPASADRVRTEGEKRPGYGEDERRKCVPGVGRWTRLRYLQVCPAAANHRAISELGECLWYLSRPKVEHWSALSAAAGAPGNSLFAEGSVITTYWARSKTSSSAALPGLGSPVVVMVVRSVSHRSSSESNRQKKCNYLGRT